jgi:uncharacterized protein
MKRDQVIAVLKQYEKPPKSFGVKSLAIFGSVARDEAHPESDVDILVEFSEPPTFDQQRLNQISAPMRQNLPMCDHY